MSKESRQTTAPQINISSVPPNFAAEPKRKIGIFIGMIVLLSIVSVVFISLYVQERGNYKRNCEIIFKESVNNSVKMIDECIGNTFDYDTKYRELVAEISCARAMIFVIDDKGSSRQVSINELYSASIKVPNQIQKNLEPLKEALIKIAGSDNAGGYKQLDELIASFDMQDYQ